MEHWPVSRLLKPGYTAAVLLGNILNEVGRLKLASIKSTFLSSVTNVVARLIAVDVFPSCEAALVIKNSLLFLASRTNADSFASGDMIR